LVQLRLVDEEMKRILFFHQGRLSNINGSVYRGLCARFPGAEVRRVDIDKLLKARPWIIAINLIVAFWVYGWDMIRRKRDLDESFFGTKYIFQKIAKLARQVHRQWPADCSFQSGSMFDFSAPDTPHFVYTDHTYQSRKEYPPYGKEVWAAIRRDWAISLEVSIYENASAIFTRSRNVTETLIHKYNIPSEKVLCVGVGTNVPLEQLCEIPITLDRYRVKRVLIIGRDWELKGGPQLVAAFEHVLKVHKDAKLTIIGCRPPIKDPSIELVGPVPLDQILGYLAQSSVFCMPSRFEPFGVVFLEALVAGLPVIALRLGAAPDFIIDGRTGTLVEHGDIKVLAQALIDLLGNPEKCQEYATYGRSLVQEKYNWDKVFKKIGDRILQITQDSKKD